MVLFRSIQASTKKKNGIKLFSDYYSLVCAQKKHPRPYDYNPTVKNFRLGSSRITSPGTALNIKLYTNEYVKYECAAIEIDSESERCGYSTIVPHGQVPVIIQKKKTFSLDLQNAHRLNW